MIEFILQIFTYEVPNVQYAVFPWLAVAVGVSALSSLWSSNKATKGANSANTMANAIAEENLRMQNEIMEKNLAFQKEEAAKLEIQKEVYRDMEFKNPYEDIENVYEDLTIDTRAAEFRAQQGQQQRANILGGLRGAAGSSGIAGLAQSLANQSQLQTQQDSITIAQQERQNQMMERQAASASDMAFRGGEASLQEMEMSRQSTLLGIQMGQTSGANAGVQQSYANQMSAGANQANLYGQQAASQYELAGQYGQNASNVITSYMMNQ